MQILLNKDNEITSFATIGGFENGIEIYNYPDTFTEVFEPRMFKYIDGAIVKNDNFYKTDESTPTNKSYEERIDALEKMVYEQKTQIDKQQSQIQELLGNQPQV